MYDVVIVGAGSAGCVLANRLSADCTRRVLLLEAGPADGDLLLKMPAGFSRIPADSPLNWGYLTEPEPYLDGRRIYWPRGRTLGGSSSTNAMVYTRGHASDYDAWRDAGNRGWGWSDLLPLFRRGEAFEGGANPLHGEDGELAVAGPDFRHPASSAFVDAGREAGLDVTEDLNDGRLAGVGFLHFTIKRGRRHSSASAFLRPALRRHNLRVVTGAHVLRVTFEQGRAQGVEYVARGRRHEIQAREIVLCAGAINTPQLLMLSGVGPAPDLRTRGVEVIHDLPGVGRNLQDHFYLTCAARVKPEASLNAELHGLNLLRQTGLWFARHRGVLALGGSQASAFVRSKPDLCAPDLQINFTPLSYSLGADGQVAIDDFPGVTTSVAHLRPRSRGSIELRGPDPFEAPSIRAGYLAAAEDRRAVLAGLRWIRRLWRQPALAALIEAEVRPCPEFQQDSELMDFVAAEGGSLFHPVGTCRMGHDPMAVVDDRLKVHGVEGLWVADASIMPTVISAPTNATAIMIGEKAADMVLQHFASR